MTAPVPGRRPARRAGVGLVVVGRLERQPRRARRDPTSGQCSMRNARRTVAGRSPCSRRANERPSTNVAGPTPGEPGERRREVDVADERAGRRARPSPPGRVRAAGTRTSSSNAVCLPAGSRCCAAVEAVVGREHDVGVAQLPRSAELRAPAARTPRSTAWSDSRRRLNSAWERSSTPRVSSAGRSGASGACRGCRTRRTTAGAAAAGRGTGRRRAARASPDGAARTTRGRGRTGDGHAPTRAMNRRAWRRYTRRAVVGRR